jgi:hypothetical protein
MEATQFPWKEDPRSFIPRSGIVQRKALESGFWSVRCKEIVLIFRFRIRV